jgi:hypothetical protein
MCLGCATYLIIPPRYSCATLVSHNQPQISANKIREDLVAGDKHSTAEVTEERILKRVTIRKESEADF